MLPKHVNEHAGDDQRDESRANRPTETVLARRRTRRGRRGGGKLKTAGNRRATGCIS